MTDQPIPNGRPLTPDEEVDNAIDESFPASDPPSYSPTKRQRDADKPDTDGSNDQEREPSRFG